MKRLEGNIERYKTRLNQKGEEILAKPKYKNRTSIQFPLDFYNWVRDNVPNDVPINHWIMHKMGYLTLKEKETT